MGEDRSYRDVIRRRNKTILVLLLALIASFALSLMTGPKGVDPGSLRTDNPAIRSIRLPRTLSGLLVGMGIAMAGAVMQCILRNPLASPFTLGVSQGAAFGASFAIICLGAGIAHRSGGGLDISNPYIIPVWAFIGAVLDAAVVTLLARLREMSPEAIVLAGVAMGSLFHALTMLLQYLAVNDVLVAATVFWMFGDIGRPYYREIALMMLVLIPSAAYFVYRRWDYNALLLGDDVAESLGIDVSRTRLTSMLLSALVTAVCVSFTGIIGFIGLAAPHIVRLAVGEDYRYLLPLSGLAGSVILLIADLAGRVVIAPAVIPVGIITSFLGAPLLVYLLARGGEPR